MQIRRVGLSVLLVGAIVGWSVAVVFAQRGAARDPILRIWTGVYADAQAARGEAAFSTRCASCHAGDLSGSRGPALAGAKFATKWELESLSKLYHQIKDNMPRDNAGSLDDPTVIDLISFILKKNGFPAAMAPATTLSADEDALDAIVIVPQTGPTKVPNFALVQVAGCLLARPDRVWTLTNASEPVSTKDVPATDADLQGTRARPLGTEIYRLVSVGPFSPERHAGERVFVKGIINRVQPDALLNVTALEPLGGKCE